MTTTDSRMLRNVTLCHAGTNVNVTTPPRALSISIPDLCHHPHRWHPWSVGEVQRDDCGQRPHHSSRIGERWRNSRDSIITDSDKSI